MTIVLAFLLLMEGAARVWLALHPPRIGRVSVPAEGIETNWFQILNSDLVPVGRTTHLYVPDLKLFWRLRPDTEVEVDSEVYRTKGQPLRWDIKINADGNRGAPYPRDSGGAAPVIAVLGDSCTFGFRVGEQETYCARLEQHLRENGLPRAAVVNYGVPGYTSFQGSRLLEEILARHRPDVVVLAFGANDLESDRYSDAEKAARAGRARFFLSRLLDRLAIFRLVRQTRQPLRSESVTPQQTAVRVPLEEYRKNMEHMIRSARDRGAQVIVLDLVFMGSLYRDTIADLGARHRVAWIDGRESLLKGRADLLSGTRFQNERMAMDRFWQEELVEYRQVYYSRDFYRRLFEDPVWRDLLHYFLIEPVHMSPLGHSLIAEEIGRQVVSTHEPKGAGDGGP